MDIGSFANFSWLTYFTNGTDVPQNDAMHIQDGSSDENTISQVGDNIQNYPLTTEDLEEIIRTKDSLKGKTLAPGVVVNGLKFDLVEVDKAILQALIDGNADVSGVNLSDQILEGIDLTDVNLSNAICTRTNFGGTKLIRTNLTGVDLNTALFDECTIIDSVIVGDADRTPYVQDLYGKLLYILEEGESRKKNGIPIAGLPDSGLKELRRNILFDIKKNSLESGQTSIDGGPQDIWINNRGFNSAEEAPQDSCIDHLIFDLRQINKKDLLESQINYLVESATIKLHKDGFTKEQKILFHYARSAIWQLTNLNRFVYFYKDSQNQGADLSKSKVAEKKRYADLLNKENLKTIYIMGGENQPRVTFELMEACFYSVLSIVRKNYPEINLQQIEEVHTLFCSPDYNW